MIMSMGLAVTFAMLMFCVVNNIYIGYALMTGTIIFIGIAKKIGYKNSDVLHMIIKGTQKSYGVIKTLTLIGGIIGIWMASGVIPSIVYYCFNLVSPNIFILSCFVLCAATAFLIGTALGTASCIGVPLMIIARSSDININIVAGAIMAGIYFGDRCSPMSSSANLVAQITDTNIYKNVANMLKTTIIPLIITCGVYLLISVLNPLNIMDISITASIAKTFNVNVFMLLPAVLILILCLMRVTVNKAIISSIVASILIYLAFQEKNIIEPILCIIRGFRLEDNHPLFDIIKGGGIISMIKTNFTVYVSCALAGIFQGINIFGKIKTKIISMRWNRAGLYMMTAVVSIVTAAIGCTQVIGAIMANEIMSDCYKKYGKEQLALDLENSGILLCVLIPWNIATLAPTTAMGVSMIAFIPYAVFIYVLPITYLFSLIYNTYKNKNLISIM